MAAGLHVLWLEHGFQRYQNPLFSLISWHILICKALLATTKADDGKFLPNLSGERSKKAANSVPAEFGGSDFVVWKQGG